MTCMVGGGCIPLDPSLLGTVTTTQLFNGHLRQAYLGWLLVPQTNVTTGALLHAIYSS